MARRLPATRAPQPLRVIHYVDPAPHEQFPTPYDQQQLHRQQKRNEELYLRWRLRQEEIRAHDKKFRRFWLGFGAVIALVFLTAMVFGGWLLWTAMGLGVLAVPAMLLIASGLALGGHRCITIVQHWH